MKEKKKEKLDRPNPALLAVIGRFDELFFLTLKDFGNLRTVAEN